MSSGTLRLRANALASTLLLGVAQGPGVPPQDTDSVAMRHMSHA